MAHNRRRLRSMAAMSGAVGGLMGRLSGAGARDKDDRGPRQVTRFVTSQPHTSTPWRRLRVVVAVVQVRSVRVVVRSAVVLVGVTVLADHRRIVEVVVVTIVVAMSVLVDHGFVRVPVPVGLREMKVYAE